MICVDCPPDDNEWPDEEFSAWESFRGVKPDTPICTACWQFWPKTCGCGCGAPVRPIRSTGEWCGFANGHGSRTPQWREWASAARQEQEGTTKRNAEICRRLSEGETAAALGREFGVSAARIEQISDPVKTPALLRVFHSIGVGKALQKPDACSRCGAECEPEAHHADYEKPLEVEWLCRLCHILADRERRTTEGA